MAGQQQDKKVRFKTVHVIKNPELGSGTYGKVYKAECDGLLCAAKMLHALCNPDIWDLIAPQREHGLLMKRFEQECEFMSTIKHPNIIQYLGMYQDPDTHLPVLLMELMDSNLTNFLESSPQPIPYHIQVNICHDITLALSFLHSNDIVHRNVSSNNVLMTGTIRAKVTDFGMARILNPLHIYHQGTDHYMPPEVFQDKPIYTGKIDCFSFGVLAVQIMTQLQPQPGDKRKKLIGIFEKRVSELERRQNHVSIIDPNNPLLAVALNCLKDKNVERPSAEELCKCIASLKQNHKYSESVRISEEQKREIVQRVELLQQQHAQQIEDFESIIQSQVVHLKDKDLMIKQKDEAIVAGLQEHQQLMKQFKREKKGERSRKDTEISKLTTRLKQAKYEKKIAETRSSELKLQLGKEDQAVAQRLEPSTEVNGSSNCKLKWWEGKKKMCKIGEMATTMNGNFIYVMELNKIYTYNASSLAWCQFSGSGYIGCALAIVKNFLTLIGGRNHTDKTNKLFSLTTENAKWTEEFPPMPTKRWGACALCTEAALIVAGGEGEADADKLATTEVLNTATLQWSTVVDLPQQMFSGSLVQIGSGTLYMLGAYDRDQHPIKAVYMCSLNALLQSCNPQSLKRQFAKSLSLSQMGLWRRVTDIPAVDSAYVSLHGQLLAIGGKDSDNKPTSAIHMYDPSNNSWKIISHTITPPRRKSYAAVLPDNQIIVVGGLIDYLGIQTDTVEIVAIARTSL